MDLSLERDGTALGSLFQQIITDMKNTSPLWEDFVAKASKLHACLKAAIQAIAAYLDAFQKIADAATNSRGATKEIGTALTRVCLRHKAVETRMKTFTTAIMDCLVLPLQDKIEDWKRNVAAIDKDHAKEYKRCRAELKKRSNDTLRLQKKARKGQSDTIQSLVDSHMQDVTLRRAELEEVERKSLRSVMVEERRKYCSFVNLLQPVVKEECEVMSELGHLQEAMESIAIVTKEPDVLPQASEELILESKSSINLYPESPGGSGSQGCSNSLGSRKSSVCSISSMNSSGSSGSPGHHYQRSLSQLISPVIRLKPGESSDSGFCSSPALTLQASSTTNQSHAVSTWPPHSQDAVQTTDRPHTISSAYEKGHQRPPLTVYTFQSPETIMESQKSPVSTAICRPPLPIRCSSLERPLSANGPRSSNPNLMQRQCPSPLPAHITKELPQHQPTYVNMSELASMSAAKQANQQQVYAELSIANEIIPPTKAKQPPPKPVRHSTDSSSPKMQPKDESHYNATSNAATSSLNTTNTNIATISNNEINNPNVSSISTNTVQTPPSSGIGTGSGSTTENNSPLLTPLTTPNELINSGGATPTNTATPTSITSPNQINNKNFTDGITNNNSDRELKITEDCIRKSVDKGDEKSRASVLEKMSIFEQASKQAAAALTVTNNSSSQLSSGRSSHSISSGDSIYLNRKEEIYKGVTNSSSNGCDKDPDIEFEAASSVILVDDETLDQIYEDSIQELNNLIGELDSFQREHEMKEKQRKQKEGNIFFDNPFSFITNDVTTTTPIAVNKSIGSENAVINTSNSLDTDSSDKISINSLNYSIQSISNGSGSDAKFTYSDSEISRYVSETSSIAGFENPTFAHFNNSNSTNGISKNMADNESKSNDDEPDGESTPVIIYSTNQFPMAPDIDYATKNSEIVVLRCKEIVSLNGDNQSTDGTECETPKQRLSSFRVEPEKSSTSSSFNSTNPFINSANLETIIGNSNTSIKYQQKVQNEVPQSPSLNRIPNTESPSVDNNSSNIPETQQDNENQTPLNSVVKNTEFKANLDEKLRQTIINNNSAASTLIKPIITPRPAYLSSGCATRIARRSSVNSKPPPPVRRSSSVTPSQNLSTPNSPNLVHQNLQNTASAESLPPPPPYLLDRIHVQGTPAATINVAETVKALSAIRHTPASPSALRRAQQLSQQTATIQSNNSKSLNNQQQLGSNIYNSQTSKFNNSDASNMYNNPNPMTQNYQQTSQKQNPLTINTNDNCNFNSNSTFRTNNSNSPGIYAQPKQITKMTSFRTPPSTTAQSPSGTPPIGGTPVLPSQKANPSLIAQLNARLTTGSAKQQQSPQHQQQQNSPDYGNYYSQQSFNNSGPNSPQHHNYNNQQESLYARGSERNHSSQQQQHYEVVAQQQIQSQKFSNQYNNPNLQQYQQQQQQRNCSTTVPLHQQNSFHRSQISSPSLPAPPIPNARSSSCHRNSVQHSQLPVHQQNYQQYNQQQQQQQHQSNHYNQPSNHHSNYNSLPHPSRHHHHNIQQKILVSTNPFITTTTVNYSPSSNSSYGNSSYGQYAANTNFAQSNYETNVKTGSIRGKSKAEFLENLNAKLAKQGLSGKAFAVRNLINSKALLYDNLSSSRLQRPTTHYQVREPDPRICHESLMDQIKRGATLKRNQKINDRSAPKIH